MSENANKQFWRKIFGDRATMFYMLGIVVVALGVYLALGLENRGTVAGAPDAAQTDAGSYYPLGEMLPSRAVFIERALERLPEASLVELEQIGSDEAAYTFDEASRLTLYLSSRVVYGFAFETPYLFNVAELPEGTVVEQYEVEDTEPPSAAETRLHIAETVAALCEALDVSDRLTGADLALIRHGLAEFFDGDETKATSEYGGYRLTAVMLEADGGETLFISFIGEF